MKKREMTRQIKDMSTKTCYNNRAGSISQLSSSDKNFPTLAR